jgi:hypothetical protein
MAGARSDEGSGLLGERPREYLLPIKPASFRAFPRQLLCNACIASDCVRD